MPGQRPFCHASAFAPGRISSLGMDETELSPDFIYAPKRHYRTFALHIALFWRPFSEAPRRAVGGSSERNKGKNFPFQPFNAWLSSIWIFQSFTNRKKTRILTLFFLKEPRWIQVLRPLLRPPSNVKFLAVFCHALTKSRNQKRPSAAVRKRQRKVP